MPFYIFKCKSCKEEEEILAKLGQKEAVCSCCDGVSNKIFSANKTIFQVNGGGAYNSGRLQGK
jgi:putative FmdB family regulatory protein